MVFYQNNIHFELSHLDDELIHDLLIMYVYQIVLTSTYWTWRYTLNAIMEILFIVDYLAPFVFFLLLVEFPKHFFVLHAFFHEPEINQAVRLNAQRCGDFVNIR